MESKKRLKRLLADGDTQQVINALLQITESGRDRRLYNEAIHQSTRYQQAIQQDRLGVARPDELRIELAKIHQALLDIIDRLQESPSAGESTAPPTPPVQPFARGIWLGAAALLTVVGVFLFVFLQARGNQDGPFDLTVRFERPDLPGYPEPDIETFKLWERKDWTGASVIDNEDLTADFKNLSRELIGKSVPVQMQARFWKIGADSLLITEDSPVLRLEPDGSLGVVVGKVTNLDDSAPIVGAIVEIEGSRELTDESGNFRFLIPNEQQKTSYQLIVSKKGYAAASHEIHPGGALIIIRLKN
ncbi:MAG: hypothetical protein KDD02_06865 [Phaeodactylibacter sp.]|nr:hypothetical protein [Phaeodactylibacter sp.]MCB9303415.1 hypothetical protein [Lewinellaceae bacterium]